MSELASPLFDTIAKAGGWWSSLILKSHWYTIRHWLRRMRKKRASKKFQAEYDALLAQERRQGVASDLLAGTPPECRENLGIPEAIQRQLSGSTAMGVPECTPRKAGDGTKVEEASLALKKAGVGSNRRRS